MNIQILFSLHSAMAWLPSKCQNVSRLTVKLIKVLYIRSTATALHSELQYFYFLISSHTYTPHSCSSFQVILVCSQVGMSSLHAAVLMWHKTLETTIRRVKLARFTHPTPRKKLSVIKDYNQQSYFNCRYVTDVVTYSVLMTSLK